MLRGVLSMSGIPHVDQLSTGMTVSSGHVTKGTRSDQRIVMEQFFVLTQHTDCNLVLYANDDTPGHMVSPTRIAGHFVVDCIGFEGNFVVQQ